MQALLDEQLVERAAVELFQTDFEEEAAYCRSRRLFDLGASTQALPESFNPPIHGWQAPPMPEPPSWQEAWAAYSQPAPEAEPEWDHSWLQPADVGWVEPTFHAGAPAFSWPEGDYDEHGWPSYTSGPPPPLTLAQLPPGWGPSVLQSHAPSAPRNHSPPAEPLQRRSAVRDATPLHDVPPPPRPMMRQTSQSVAATISRASGWREEGLVEDVGLSDDGSDASAASSDLGRPSAEVMEPKGRPISQAAWQPSLQPGWMQPDDEIPQASPAAEPPALAPPVSLQSTALAALAVTRLRNPMVAAAVAASDVSTGPASQPDVAAMPHAPILVPHAGGLVPGAAPSSLGELLAARRAAETAVRAVAAAQRDFTTGDFRQLFSFCRHGKYRQAKELLKAGCPVDGRDQFGNTPLIIACQNGHARLVKALLRHGASVDAANRSGNTGLHYAVAFNFTVLADFLVSQGANDKACNSAGLTCYEGIK